MVPQDAAGRLAQGRPAVDVFGEYVRACQHLGYSHPDLTERVDQVHDWYATEDGLRLDALSSDAETLRLVGQAADHVTQQQADLLAELTAAWSGRGAETALDFLARNQHAAVTAGAAIREAAESLNSLRDELWGAVDARVTATLSLDAGRRADWLAAARTVTSGEGDRSTASEIVDRQVKPFVDNVIRAQWVNEMRSSTAAVEDAYRAATARLRNAAETIFEVPGQLGPRWAEDSAAPSVAVSHVEAGATPVPSAPAAPAAVAFSPPPPSVPLDPPTTEPVGQQPLPGAGSSTPAASPLGDLGSLGSGASGSGLSGFGQQLADLIGGLVGGSGDDEPDLDPFDPDDEDPDEPDDDSKDDEDDDSKKDESPDDDLPEGGPPGDPLPTDPVAAEATPPPSSPIATASAAPTPTPVATETLAPPRVEEMPAPPPPEPTPCEIAADELPQVGE